MEQTLQGTNIPRVIKPIETEPSELHIKNKEENKKHGSGIADVDKRVIKEINGYVPNPFNRDDLIKGIEKEYKVYEEIKSLRPTGSINILDNDSKNIDPEKIREERLKFLIKKDQEKILKKKANEKESPDIYKLKKLEAREKAENLEKLKEEKKHEDEEKTKKLRENMRNKYSNY